MSSAKIKKQGHPPKWKAICAQYAYSFTEEVARFFHFLVHHSANVPFWKALKDNYKLITFLVYLHLPNSSSKTDKRSEASFRTFSISSCVRKKDKWRNNRLHSIVLIMHQCEYLFHLWFDNQVAHIISITFCNNIIQSTKNVF